MSRKMRMDNDGLTETYDRSILMRDPNNSVSLKILFTSFLKGKQTNNIRVIYRFKDIGLYPNIFISVFT